MENLTIDENVTIDGSPSSLTFACYIIHEILFIIFALLGIFLDVLIIYTIAKHEKIRTVANIYIANWAAADILSMVFAPSAYDVLLVLEHISGYHSVSYVIFKIATVAHIALNLSVVIVVFDWIIATYFPRSLETFHIYYKLVLGSLWILTLMTGVIFMATCKKYYPCYVSELELFVSFGFLILLVTTLQIVQAVKKFLKRPPPDSTLRLTLASIFVAVWFLGFSNLIFLKWVVSHPLISVLFDCITFSTSFINIVLLYKYDFEFQACLLQVIKRNRYTERFYHFRNPLVEDRNNANGNGAM